MADTVSPAKRSEMMAGIRSKNTRPEVVVRKLLHRAGYRFRLHSNTGGVKPDLVLPKWKAAVFVHGCFWHGHSDCHLYRLPKSNPAFWSAKVNVNKRRDQRAVRTLTELGWNVISVWECAVRGRRKRPSEDLVRLLSDAIQSTSRHSEIVGHRS